MSLSSVVLSATGLFTPKDAISNEELVTAFNQYVSEHNQLNHERIEKGECEALQNSSVAFIEKASGIKSRFVIDKKGILDPDMMHPVLPKRDNDEVSIQAQMGLKAAEDALARAGLQGEDIDLIIVACSNLQRAYPAISIEIQAALGAVGFAFDMNVACSSATFGLDMARNAIISGSANKVLVINAEITAAHLNFRDRDSHFIFGDAATALLLEREEDIKDPHQGFRFLGSSLRTQYSNNIRNNFGFLNRCEPQTEDDRDKLFVQNGRKVFKEVCPAVGEHIVKHLDALSIAPEKISRFWLHQANLSMNQLISRRILGRDATEKEAPVILDQYANTSSAGSVIALHLHHDDLTEGELGILSSFGAGYSIGSIVLEKR